MFFKNNVCIFAIVIKRTIKLKDWENYHMKKFIHLVKEMRDAQNLYHELVQQDGILSPRVLDVAVKVAKLELDVDAWLDKNNE